MKLIRGAGRMLLWLLLATGATQDSGLTLQECIREALRNRPEVAVAAAEVMEAEAGAVRARSGYLPHLSLDTASAYTRVGRQDAVFVGGEEVPFPRQAYAARLHSFGLHLQQNILDGGRWWQAIGRAGKDVERARMSRLATQQDVVLTVIEAFFQLLKAREQLKVLAHSLALSQEQLHLAQERRRVGAASRVDVSRAKVSAAEDRINITRQQALIGTLEADLNSAMGRPPGGPLTLQPLERTRRIPPELHQRPNEEHPRLKAMDAACQVVDMDISIAQAGHWPQLSGSIGYTRQNPDFVKVYSRLDELYSLSFMLRVSVPLFEGFLTASQVDAAQARAKRMQAEDRLTKQRLEASLLKAGGELRQLEALRTIASEGIAAAEDTLTLARERYQIGEGTTLEVRDAQLSVTRARWAEVETHFDFEIALARYHHAFGDLVDVYVP